MSAPDAGRPEAEAPDRETLSGGTKRTHDTPTRYPLIGLAVAIDDGEVYR